MTLCFYEQLVWELFPEPTTAGPMPAPFRSHDALRPRQISFTLKAYTKVQDNKEKTFLIKKRCLRIGNSHRVSGDSLMYSLLQVASKIHLNKKALEVKSAFLPLLTELGWQFPPVPT